MILLAARACYVLTLIWIGADAVLFLHRKAGIGQMRPVWLIRRALDPLFLPAAGVNAVLEVRSGYHADLIYLVVCVAIWFLREKDDDDWWRKLRDKATGVVKNLGHRLTVAPEPAGA